MSDSLNVMPAMLTTQLNELVLNGSLQPNCVIRISEYLCNTVPSRKYVHTDKAMKWPHFGMDFDPQPCFFLPFLAVP